MDIEILSNYLDTYRGRDKILSTLSYIAKLATVVTTSEITENKLKIFSSKISECRVALRLLDDLPTFHYATKYKWGKQESDWFIRSIELIQIGVNMIFCPIEHICWAGENKIVSLNSKLWNNVIIWFWVVSLHLSLTKSLRKLSRLKLNESQGNGMCENSNEAKESINRDIQEELLTCLCLLLDITYAVNYLPSGVLWGGFLKTWHVGALGTISCCVSVYRALHQRVMQKKKL
ncbi:PREDICTED: peroxisomal membrane protein 11C isoform X2 [Polistes dominula]|uniref:Peroxisomal membrane protein 11C isoform X2 n=1 Tax=Polistes dominula TaxID=743375 RepID=A0ABM1I867_POLDO|nr:PREDICTED: peroxisomal membrane protein 11C isoform X2 [Polistes dominula]